MTLDTSWAKQPIMGPGHLSMRLVTPDDADYITQLRTDQTYNAHLSSVSGSVEAQRAWIETYKKDEQAGTQYYFIIQTHDGQQCGVVRLYNITADDFTWGSWILDHNKPPKAALESAYLIYNIAFERLGLPRAVFEVIKENAHTLAFHRRFGARETHTDDVNVYFEYTPDLFARDKAAFAATLRGDNE